MSRADVKLPAIAEIEAVMGRELTGAERSALYGLPGGIGRLNASKRRLGPMRKEILAQAARLQEEAGDRQAQAKALRAVARGLSAHRGVSGQAWSSLVSVRSSSGAAVCPECGTAIEPPAAGAIECPECGSTVECRRAGGESWLTAVGPESRPMSAIADLAKGGRP